MHVLQMKGATAFRVFVDGEMGRRGTRKAMWGASLGASPVPSDSQAGDFRNKTFETWDPLLLTPMGEDGETFLCDVVTEGV